MDAVNQAIELKAKEFLKEKGYTVQVLLGKGSFGRVYKAHDFQNNRIVAIKALIPDYQRDEGVLLNLVKSFQEIQNASSINSEYVVKIYESYLDKDLFVIFIVQEFCSRGNLDKYMQGIPNLTQNTLKNIIIQILKGIIDIHKKQIIHSDIKPENILVDEREIIKIGDFGEAKQLKKDKNQTQATGASPIFAAPEVNDKSLISFESDYYSVGAVICIISGLQYKDLQMIQVGVLPDVRNLNNKNLLLLAFNMMSISPNKRAPCSQVLQILEQTSNMSSFDAHSSIQDLSTQYNDSVLVFFKQNNHVVQIQQNQNHLIEFPRPQLQNKCLSYLFWTIWILCPLFLAGNSIYFMTKSCFIFQHLIFVIICLLLSYFSGTSLLTAALELPPNRPNNIIEFVLNLAFFVCGCLISYLVLLPFPCINLYVCTSFIDVRFSEIVYNRYNTTDTSENITNKFYSICKSEEPDRRYSLEKYFEQNYSPEIQIQYYSGISWQQFPFIISTGVMFLWILLRLKWYFCPQCKFSRIFKCS
ncbi:Serine/Threonine kinase domain protein (macronuclear) [Tetrahymena thermophila SB210]|uniref:non-specific serine/threonine protein kinase n=1 Tax=Tetrahymena thermophila (strain SB210) TaxID=312017 RepID=Q22AJ5_TETTS|nr:Serine/Threonine kinase domain protein [Tetrahymena thermophila SB210]EAR82321.2 Serine/Threonine kinase domain protein [Tetrahymena thermophila SB210]|eukprot:XP_001029984.2 Serine/Threonine kinase domain protein [Tetrahymena thermophila SB210]